MCGVPKLFSIAIELYLCISSPSNKKGPALMAVWSKASPLVAGCLSPLPGFESRPRHMRKRPVTWG